MATTATKTLITAEEFMAMPDPPDGSQQELDRGEVVTMPPPKGLHGVVCGNVGFAVMSHVRANSLGHVAINDAGVLLARGPDTLRGPDIAFYSNERVPILPESYFEMPPDLVAEVVSPSDSYSKLRQKVRQYLKAGVRTVWVVDPEERTVEVHKPDELMRVLDNGDLVEGDAAIPGFSCQVADLFPPLLP